MDADPVRTVSSATQSLFVAAGGSVNWTVSLQALQDGAGLPGVEVAWSASGQGVALESASEVTDATGTASVSAQVSGLSAGSEATVTGCAWGTDCANWTVNSVDPSVLQVGVSSGGNQSVTNGSALGPVMLQVSDGAGHPVAGATVNVAQTVDAWEGDCAVPGRCAAAPVLASSKTMAVSDVNGNVAVAPQLVPGVAQVVNIAVSAGTSGFATAALVIAP
jgi:hypothetical protein